MSKSRLILYVGRKMAKHLDFPEHFHQLPKIVVSRTGSRKQDGCRVTYGRVVWLPQASKYLKGAKKFAHGPLVSKHV